MWRTLRVLANPARLGLLRDVCTRPSQCVNALAGRAGLGQPAATQHLRLLQARGLIRARRDSRWVFYTAEADPLVAHAPALLGAMQRALVKDRVALPAIAKAVTAFTHERRIRIVQAVVGGVDTPGRLAAACRISTAALARHLDKLERRGVLARGDGRVRLPPPATALAAALLAVVKADGRAS